MRPLHDWILDEVFAERRRLASRRRFLFGSVKRAGGSALALVATIQDLRGEPVEEGEYDFGYTDVASFLMTAQALENTGVSAYDGAGQFLTSPGLLTTAGTIVAVEARHASYLNLLNGLLPFPAPFETPLSPDEVLAIARPFIVSADTVATPAA